MHWIKDQELAIRNIYQMLANGGKALFVACPRSSDDDLQVVCRKLVLTLKWFFYFVNFKSEHSFVTESAYVEMFKKVGFHVDKINPLKTEVVFPNRVAFENFLQSILTPLYHLPERKRDPFLRDLLCKFAERKGKDLKGQIELHVAQIEMFLSKVT